MAIKEFPPPPRSSKLNGTGREGEAVVDMENGYQPAQTVQTRLSDQQDEAMDLESEEGSDEGEDGQVVVHSEFLAPFTKRVVGRKKED